MRRTFLRLGPSRRWLGFLTFASAALAADPAGQISSRPLAPRGHPQGAKLFTLLSPDETGIKAENNFDDPRMHGDLYEEFETSSVGSGVAIGDYDGDGLPDIYVVSKTNGCHLYHNLGNYKFEDVTDKAGVGATPGVWNEGATFVDINNSGRLDIYVCRTNAPNLLYINQGDGTFKEMAHAYGLDVVDASVMAGFCDYDRDGLLDVFITTNILNITTHPNGQRGILLHHQPDGHFVDVTDHSGIGGESQSHSATWWDYDNDGWPDLYVANDYGYPDRLYHNNHNGTFTESLEKVAPHTSFSSMGADLGDVNNTGRIDLLVADMAATTHFKDHHNIADNRSRTEENVGSQLTPKYHQNVLLLNTGTARFQEAARLEGVAATDWTWSVRWEDLDNDGRLDLFVTNGFPRDPGVDVLRRAMGAETPAERVQIMYASPMTSERHLGLRNMGDYRFEDESTAWGLDQRGVSFGAALGDLSGDGNLDIVYVNYRAVPTILRNDCATGHVVNVDLRGTVSNRYGVGAMVRVESALGVQARTLVLARGYMSSSEPMLHFGLGADTVVRRMTVTWPSGHVQTFENLAVDRRYTVTEPAVKIPIPRVPGAGPTAFTDVSAARGFDAVTREDPVDETVHQRLLPTRLNARGPALAIGDVRGRGRDDVLVGGSTLDPLRAYQLTPEGAFISEDVGKMANPADVDDGPILVFDATGTGSADVLVTRGGNSLAAGSPDYQPALFLNNGQGRFVPAPAGALPDLPISVGAVAAADFDHSGRLGLFVGGRVEPGDYPQPPQSALLANRGGRFEDVTDAIAPALRHVGMVTAALWTDVDGDGWSDLLVALEWGPVRYFHNDHGQKLEDWTDRAGFSSGGTGWWTSLTGADFNGDGRIDYVVGNVGLNTPYHADQKHPVLLFRGAFKPGSPAVQLLEGYFEGDTLYPFRTRRDYIAVLPALGKRFPTADAFARASLPDLIGPERLDKAERFAATQLQSGVFLSQPDGTYKFQPLPRIAQIAPLDGIVAGDFTGSGHADIYAVQNSFAPNPSVGRFDGGLSQLLTGDGKGDFIAVPVAESGLLVPGNAKALAVVDLDDDGWPDFLITRNNGSTLAFHNEGRPGGHPLRIRLRGGPGNRTAVGARVTVHWRDGGTETAEVYAGSGYYSQSSAALFFGYREGRPPAEVTVTWPSGQSTTYPLTGSQPTLELSQP